MSEKTNKKSREIDWNKKENTRLLEAFLALKNKNEARRFLRDLMTKKEIMEFANRLDAAYELARDTQYTAISESTGLSSTTIARIKKWLIGPLGGYRLVLPRLSSSALNSMHHYNSSKLGKGLSLSS